jgi:hypothetical protein
MVDTSNLKCNCQKSDGSWLSHWSIQKNAPIPKYCSTNGCLNEVEIGAHVVAFHSEDHTPFIVPICHECSVKAISFEVDDHMLASADCK